VRGPLSKKVFYVSKEGLAEIRRLMEVIMVPGATTVPHASRSDTRLRRLLGGMSVFTMVMTIPQVLHGKVNDSVSKITGCAIWNV
jgi:hypothetical protein